jgi:hypothetical protein
MIWIDILSAIIVASVLTILFSVVIGRRGPWESNLLFFFLVFLGAWAGGLWLKPIKPAFYGYYLINYLIAGFILALLIAATGPIANRNKRQKVELKTDEELHKERKLKGIDVLLSLLIFLLIVIIISGYIITY